MNTRFLGRRSGPETGWVVQTLIEGSTQPDTILTKALILSAGLSCVHLLNSLLPPNERLTAYYAKGEYDTITSVIH
jgi:2-hydroxyglutarate dehydrogenase